MQDKNSAYSEGAHIQKPQPLKPKCIGFSSSFFFYFFFIFAKLMSNSEKVKREIKKKSFLRGVKARAQRHTFEILNGLIHTC